MDVTLRQIAPPESERALEIINAAAQWYATFLPPDELHVPEMTWSQWHEESARMRWFGAYSSAALVAVMGLEPKADAWLIRHAYVDPAVQRQRYGSRLLEHVENQVPQGDLLIAGTYSQNHRARGLFQRHGYIVSRDCAAVLRKYYSIPVDRLRASVTYEKVRR